MDENATLRDSRRSTRADGHRRPPLSWEGVTISSPGNGSCLFAGSFLSRLPDRVSEDAARRRRASRVPQMCPECVRVFSGQTTTKCRFAGTLGKSSDGLEPSTPPSMERLRQPAAASGNGFRLFSRFRGAVDLPAIAAGCNPGAPAASGCRTSRRFDPNTRIVARECPSWCCVANAHGARLRSEQRHLPRSTASAVLRLHASRSWSRSSYSETMSGSSVASGVSAYGLASSRCAPERYLDTRHRHSDT